MQVEWDQIVTYYLLYSLGGLAILLTLLHMLYRRRSPTSIIAWLLIMVIAPYFFVFFYFLFGVRKRSLEKEKSSLAISEKKGEHPSAHPIDRLLRSNGIPSSSSDNTLRLYTDGVEAYETLYDALDKAEHSISLSTYVLKYDTVTKALFELLIKKSLSGVKVRILTDAVGSIEVYLRQLPLKRLKDAGVTVSFFMPLFGFPFHNRFNLRYHRKIYLIDDALLFSGGMNLSKEYMGPSHTKKRWVDLLYRCEGSIVSYYIDIFESDWAFTQQLTPKKTFTAPSSKKGECKLQVIPSGPDVRNDALLEAIIYGIHQASRRVWIVTPYFLPNEPILQALRIAHHRGVDVKLITPKESDHLFADFGRSSYTRELHDSNIDVALYEGPMLHAKAILFDDDAAMLGSVNLDNRSLLLNYEVVTIAYSKEQIDAMLQWMNGLLQRSTSRIEPAGKFRRIFENLMRVFASQL